jgi:uncharacterized protein YegL
MGNQIQKTDKNEVITNTGKSPLDKLNNLNSGLSAALSKMELPRQFSQLVLFVLDGSYSMTGDGASGFSKGQEIHQSVVKVLERLQSSKNKASFDVGFWAFANESKEMYPVKQLKDYNLVKDCFNPCEFISDGGATYLSETFQSVERVVNDYLDEHKELNRKVLIILLSDGELHDYQEVIEMKSKFQSELVVFSSIFFESLDWGENYEDWEIDEIKENLSNLASEEAYFLSTVDAEQIRKHMIQSVTKISNVLKIS